jgi:predicted nucleotidyltransferase
LDIEAAKRKLKEILLVLRERFSVKRIGVFGSYVRGEQKKGSDLDVLVELYETVDLFELVELEDFISESLGVKVDLVLQSALKPRIKDRILSEVVYV